MKHLIIDGMNFMHRARAGFQLGPHPLMFNFFRNLRAQVELHKPDRIWYVLEGYPKHRHEALPEYKANRELQIEDPDYASKVDEMKRFFAGNNDVLELMMKCFPITVARHPDFECDDTIHYLVGKLIGEVDEVTIVSSDTDFIQSLQEFPHNGRLKLYNPMKKVFVEAPEGYNYVHWKALRGDGSDNIPGIPGVGDKTAEKMLMVPGSAVKFTNNPEHMEIFRRNCGLIRFHEFTEENGAEQGVQTWTGKADWIETKRVFDSYNFNSITNDKSWKKFTETFDKATPK